MNMPDPTWMDLAVRWFVLAVFGLTAGLCLGQSIWRRGLRAVALFAFAALAIATAYSQISLLNAPINDRTWWFFGAACVQIFYWLVLFFGNLDDPSVQHELDRITLRNLQLQAEVEQLHRDLRNESAAGGTP